MPILPTDERSQWDEELLNDPRVTHLWDEERAAGQWFADPNNLGLQYPGRVMWDAFLLFGPEARWDDAPSHLLASGWTVIGNTEQLETTLDTHLAEAGTPAPATATPGAATPAAAASGLSVQHASAMAQDTAR